MERGSSFTFTTPLNVNVVNIKGVEHLFVEGDISSNDIDYVNDVMSKKCQESMQKQIIERNMKLDLEHEAFRGETTEEKEINKTKIPAGKLVDAMVKSLGKERYSTRVKGEINRHNPDYKNIKGNLMDKYLDAFSVAFLPIDVKYQNKDRKAITFEQYKNLKQEDRLRVLDDVLLLNVALTGNPCNTKAQLTEVFMKSMDAVEEYKKLKTIDPSIENNLVVKTMNKKENPLSYIWNKMMVGEVLTKSELKLLKAAIDVANNQGLQKQLADELYNKIASGIKLSYKDYYIFRELIEVDHQADGPVMAEIAKSHSTNLVGGNSLKDLKQINKKNSKMTEEPNNNVDPVDAAAANAEGADANADANADVGADANADAGDSNESGDAEQKTLFSAMSADLKTMSEKYDAVVKENEGIKADIKAMAENLAKITEALSMPVHKSAGIQPTDAATNAKADVQGKSVDPLSLF